MKKTFTTTILITFAFANFYYNTAQADEIHSLIELNKETFMDEVVNTKTPVLLDFYADWCVPCKAMQAVLEELNQQYQGRIKFVKVNVDNEKEIAEKFRINELPVLLFIKEGKIAGIHTDFSEKEVLEAKIKEYLL